MHANELQELQRLVAYQRDEVAYRQLFKACYPMAMRFCKRFLHANELAEEAVSDVMMKLWLMETKLAEVRNLKVYVMQAVKNKAMDYLDSHRHQTLNEEYPEYLPAGTLTPEEAMISSEAVHAINQAIDTLPTKCRAVFLLVRESKCTYREAAEIMGISENTVNRHIQKAVNILAQKLGF